MDDEVEIPTEQRERSGRREQNKAENRTALLKAARAVFAEMGYGAASVRDIVRRTDLASGTFYNYFKDKDEIFEAVVGELTGELLRRHREGRAKAATAEEFFRRHYAVYFEFVVEDAELLALARKNFTAIRTLFDKPDVRALALALNEDIRAAHGPGHPAQCRRFLPRRLDGGHRLRDLGGHGRARPGRPRRRHRIRHAPDDGRPRQSAEALIPPQRSWEVARGPDAECYAPCTIGLRSTPIFSISTSQTSPGFSQGCGLRAMATPEGVPVMMMSPGSSVMTLLSSCTRVGTSKIRSSVLLSCMTSPLTRVMMRSGAPPGGSSSDVTMSGPKPPVPSKFLPSVNWPPDLRCQSRTEPSLKQA